MSASCIHLDDKSGYMHLIMGPMYCGKTNSLLNELLRFDVVGARVLYLNSALDTRTDAPFSTHHPLVQSIGKITGKKIDQLSDVYDECKEFDVIGIDEAQFFTGLCDFVLNMVEREGKRVIVAGLSGNFRREPFGEQLSLVPYADRVEKLHALCTECATVHRKIKEAHFSYRLEPARDTNDEIVVGASDKYVPLCRSCYLFKENQRVFA